MKFKICSKADYKRTFLTALLTHFSSAFFGHFKPVTLLPYGDNYCYIQNIVNLILRHSKLSRKPIKASVFSHNECKVLQYCQWKSWAYLPVMSKRTQGIHLWRDTGNSSAERTLQKGLQGVSIHFLSFRKLGQRTSDNLNYHLCHF